MSVVADAVTEGGKLPHKVDLSAPDRMVIVEIIQVLAVVWLAVACPQCSKHDQFTSSVCLCMLTSKCTVLCVLSIAESLLCQCGKGLLPVQEIQPSGGNDSEHIPKPGTHCCTGEVPHGTGGAPSNTRCTFHDTGRALHNTT